MHKSVLEIHIPGLSSSKWRQGRQNSSTKNQHKPSSHESIYLIAINYIISENFDNRFRFVQIE